MFKSPIAESVLEGANGDGVLRGLLEIPEGGGSACGVFASLRTGLRGCESSLLGLVHSGQPYQPW